MTIRSMVVATAAIVRSGLSAMMTIDRTIAVVGTIADLELLAPEIDRLRPDVILLDLSNYDRAIVWEKLSLIQEAQDPIGIVLMINDFDSLDIYAAMRAGVRGILADRITESALVAAILTVAAGLVVLDPEAIDRFYPQPQVMANPGLNLTPREIEVLVRLGAGLSNKAIAQSLYISEHTVKFHISSIFQKLGVSTRTEAVTVGVRLGLILL